MLEKERIGSERVSSWYSCGLLEKNGRETFLTFNETKYTYGSFVDDGGDQLWVKVSSVGRLTEATSSLAHSMKDKFCFAKAHKRAVVAFL